MYGWVLLFLAAICFSCCLGCAVLAVATRGKSRAPRQAGRWARLLAAQVEEAERCGVARTAALALIASLVAVPPLLTFLLAPAKPLLALLVLLLSLGLPRLAWRVLRQRYLRTFKAQVPDALGMIASSISAGGTITMALETAANEMPAPAGKEFGRVVRALKLGTEMRDALQMLKERVPCGEISLTVVSMMVARETGGDLPGVLKKVAATVNERVRISGKVKSLTAQSVLSGWVVGLVPVFLLGVIYMLEPDYVMPLFNTGAGLAVLGGCLLMEILGLFSIRRIVNIRM